MCDVTTEDEKNNVISVKNAIGAAFFLFYLVFIVTTLLANFVNNVKVSSHLS